MGVVVIRCKNCKMMNTIIGRDGVDMDLTEEDASDKMSTAQEAR